MKLYKQDLIILERYMTINPIVKSVVLRFIRGFVAGAVSVMVTSVAFTSAVNDWHSLSAWMGTLALAGVVGGISGGLLAIDKLTRSWKEE